ncbi:hypothetical protein PO124_34685 [Bacillus licheniformis]|nr:hypothetical protein [Bacillus licheniformis]
MDSEMLLKEIKEMSDTKEEIKKFAEEWHQYSTGDASMRLLNFMSEHMTANEKDRPFLMEHGRSFMMITDKPAHHSTAYIDRAMYTDCTFSPPAYKPIRHLSHIGEGHSETISFIEGVLFVSRVVNVFSPMNLAPPIMAASGVNHPCS